MRFTWIYETETERNPRPFVDGRGARRVHEKEDTVGRCLHRPLPPGGEREDSGDDAMHPSSHCRPLSFLFLFLHVSFLNILQISCLNPLGGNIRVKNVILDFHLEISSGHSPIYQFCAWSALSNFSSASNASLSLTVRRFPYILFYFTLCFSPFSL